MNESILARIKAMPPLNDTILKIQSICSDRDSSIGDLSKTIEKDPMLTANILKAANSPLYGFSKEIKNVNHAISLFGMATIRGFALSSAIRQNIKIDLSPYSFSETKFLNLTVLQSILMKEWYKKINGEMADVLITAAFLMELGKIIIAHELIESGMGEKFKEKLEGISTTEELSKLEKEFVGFANEEITAKIFDQWNLEVEIVKAIEFSENITAAPDHVSGYAKALKILKASINIFEQLTENSVKTAASLVEKYGLNQDAFIEATKRVKH